MPGYRPLATHVNGDAADLVREAETLQRDGDLAGAAALLERAVEDSEARSGVFPAWGCGRLASLYRALGRYDDEVALLERYCDSPVSDEAKTRFIARLSKARAVAARARNIECGALRTVKEAKGRLSKSGQRAKRGTITLSSGLIADSR